MICVLKCHCIILACASVATVKDQHKAIPRKFNAFEGSASNLRIHPIPRNLEKKVNQSLLQCILTNEKIPYISFCYMRRAVAMNSDDSFFHSASSFTVSVPILSLRSWIRPIVSKSVGKGDG